MNGRQISANARAFGQGAIERIKEFWDDYSPVVIGVAIGLITLGVHEYGYKSGYTQGSHAGFTSGWDECDKVTTKTLQDHNPELANEARAIMREHSAETIANMYPTAFGKD